MNKFRNLAAVGATISLFVAGYGVLAQNQNTEINLAELEEELNASPVDKKDKADDILSTLVAPAPEKPAAPAEQADVDDGPKPTPDSPADQLLESVLAPVGAANAEPQDAIVVKPAVAPIADGLDDNGNDADGEEEARPTFESPAAAPEMEPVSPASLVAKPAAKPSAEPVAELAVKPVAEPAPEPAAEPVAEPAPEPVAEPVAEPASEPATEPVAEPVAEPAPEPAAEPVAEPVAEPAPEPAAEPVAEPVVEPVADPTAGQVAAPLAEPVAKPVVGQVVAPDSPDAGKFDGPDAELLSSAYETELLRRRAMEEQARREIEDARRAMADEEYQDAIKHYRNASRYLTDNIAKAEERKECQQGIAEGYYRAAIQEDRIGRRERAMKLMDKAVMHRHPKARRQLETWKAADDPDANKTEIGAIRHRINETEYKEKRDRQAARLKRARQLMSTRELDAAQNECEAVLKEDAYNEEAHALRRRIIRMRRRIYSSEMKSSREGMIAAVDQAWRPVYATNARDARDAASKAVKKVPEDDPERRQELDIMKRMKEMRLPAISFKPPMTIADAVEFFIGASRDYDRPDKPMEQRGFNIILRTPEVLQTPAAQPAAAADGFGAEEDAAAGQQTQNNGLPVIPFISASNLSFYEALKYVCDSVDYKFKVQGPMVIVMHKNMSIDEMVTRSYPVLASFIERVDSASSALREMKAGNAAGAGGGMFNAGGGDDNSGGEKQERDWKEFFTMLGVNWPEGSSIMYIKALGKLRVKNTYENLAELEKALNEMSADPRLVEIEARFVEVCQEDLNSLGFEWILNSDYSLGLGRHLSRLLRVRNGKYGTLKGLSSDTSATTSSGTTTTTTDTSASTGTTTTDPIADALAGGGNTSGNGTANQGGGSSSGSGSGSGSSALSPYTRTVNADWIRSGRAHHGNVGLDAINGSSVYKTGQRWLSDLGNHVSGEGVSNNDQFMRLNAYLGGADLSMILHMLAQRSDTDLLSAPKVLTRPGEEAVMKVVTEFIYPTDYDVQLQSSRSGGYGESSQSAILAVVEPQSFVMREVGVILQATPTLTDDGNLIDLKLRADVVDEPTWKNYGMRIPFSGNSSQVNFAGIEGIFTGLTSILATLGQSLTDAMKATFAETAVQSASDALDNLSNASNNNITYYDVPMEQPFFHVRSVDSSVSVYPGATIVMGGLITEMRRAMDDKIPFLGDLPFIGRFFRNHSEKTTKRNLLIFVTTRLVDVSGREITLGSDKDEKDSEKVQPAPAAAP